MIVLICWIADDSLNFPAIQYMGSMHMYIYTHTHTHTHTLTHAYTYTHTHKHTRAHHTHTHIHIHTHTHPYIMHNTRIPYSFVGDCFLFAVYCSIVYCIQLSQMIPWLHQSTKCSITRGVQLSKILWIHYLFLFYMHVI